MRKVIFSFLILGLISCGKKQWSKEYLTTKCNTEFKKKNEAQKLLTDPQLIQICDCIADKMHTKYKSEAEADKDQAGSAEIGRDCAMSVMAPPPMEPSIDTSVNPIDTTN